MLNKLWSWAFGPKISLASDYQDYYDSAFPKTARREWRRFKSEDRDLKHALQFLSDKGVPTIPFGSVRQLVQSFDMNDEIDVHFNDRTITMNIVDAFDMHPDEFAVQNIKEVRRVSYLQIGLKSYWYGWYTSATDTHLINGNTLGLHPVIRLPFFRVDFLPLADCFPKQNFSSYRAVNFSTAPLLRGTVIEQWIQPDNVVLALEGALQHLVAA